MAIIVLGFIAILLATFAVVIAMTRQSPNQQTIAQRMALIRITAKREAGATAETTQLFKAARKSRFVWLDEMLQNYQFAQKLQLRILQGNSSTTVATLLLASLGLFVTGYCLVWLFVPMVLVGAGAGLALGLLPYGLLSLKRSRRVGAFNAVLADSIDMLARALRAGHSVVSAIEMLSENAQEPAASEFGEIFKQMNLGLPMRDALLQLLERVPSADLRVLVTAILVQKDTGGNLAEILDRTVFVIRERLRIQGEIQVQTAREELPDGF